MKWILSLLLLSPLNANAFFGFARSIAFNSSSTNSAVVDFVASCTGACVVTDVGDDRVLKFTTGTGSACFNVDGVLSEMLLVGQGGGQGGGYNAGAGGAGGMVEIGTIAVTAGCHTVVVGSTAGVNGGIENGTAGQSGANSSFDDIVALGGGGGGSYDSVACHTGGSGGGGASNAGVGCASIQTNVGGGIGYGYSGGTAGAEYSSGGGGAGGAGEGGNTGNPAYGGVGRVNDITGSSVTYATGGTFNVNTGPCDSTENTGNGASALHTRECNGRSGIVVLRYTR